MQTATETAERRTGTHRLVNQMLEARQEMWVLYCQVAGFEPYDQARSLHEAVGRFCEALMDYISTGHFSLYERIAEGRERRRAVRDVATEVYGRIARTTDIALQFNDRYDPAQENELDERFSQDMSELGEALALRIELEDRIIDEMLSA